MAETMTTEQIEKCEAICDKCKAPKGLHAVGESCNNNCGGKVIENPHYKPEPNYTIKWGIIHGSMFERAFKQQGIQGVNVNYEDETIEITDIGMALSSLISAAAVLDVTRNMVIPSNVNKIESTVEEIESLHRDRRQLTSGEFIEAIADCHETLAGCFANLRGEESGS